ncbi:MAG: YoaK family protein [Chthoniobacterales bacterium]
MLIAGLLLAFGAGFANASVFLLAGTSVSHLTGDVAKLSFDIVHTSPELISDIMNVTSATLGFFAGAFLAGVFIHHPKLDTARPYGRAITCIGVLFIAAHFALPSLAPLGIGIAALACGLQNSLASRYRGLVLRTTHLTGLITDFGISLGMSARGFQIPRWKILLPAGITLSFFGGGTAASVVLIFVRGSPVLLVGAAYVSAGILWSIYKHVWMSETPRSCTTENPARPVSDDYRISRNFPPFPWREMSLRISLWSSGSMPNPMKLIFAGSGSDF